MLSCWTQRMQRRQRFCSNLHVSISVYVCPCVSVHVCTEPAWTQQIAWYELYYQKFYRSVTFCPANMCPFTRLMFTILFTLEPSDLLIPMAIEQDGDQAFCKTPGPVEHSRMISEWMNDAISPMKNGDGLCMIKLIQIVYIDFTHHPPTNTFEIRMRLWCWKMLSCITLCVSF